MVASETAMIWHHHRDSNNGVSTLKLAVCAIVGPNRVRKSNNPIVAVAIVIEVQSKVCCGTEILKHSICRDQMAGEWTEILSAGSI